MCIRDSGETDHQLRNAEDHRKSHRALHEQFPSSKEQADAEEHVDGRSEEVRHVSRAFWRDSASLRSRLRSQALTLGRIVLNRINATNLKGDVFGGLTAAVIALPMALAFGIASGAGAAAGLWGAVIIGLVASLFGGTPTLISEPTGPMTVVFTSVIISFTATADSPEQALAMAFSVGVLAGIFQILFGLFRLGRYVTMMPYTVISGFMSGIGIILVLLQLGPFLGQATPKGGVMGTLLEMPALVQGTQPMELLLALITLAILWFTPSAVKKVCPPQLLALVVGTVLALSLFSGAGLRTIPEFSAAFPSFQLPTFSSGQLRLMVIDAAVLGMLGCIDALLTSVVADSLTRTEHNSNKELIGQGLANVVSGLFGAMPGAGATMGTVVNTVSYTHLTLPTICSV